MSCSGLRTASPAQAFARGGSVCVRSAGAFRLRASIHADGRGATGHEALARPAPCHWSSDLGPALRLQFISSGYQLSGERTWPGLLILLLWVASFVVAGVFVVLAMALSFRARDTIAVQLRVILVSYLGGILVFAGLYFSMALIGDLDYAVAHYAYYEAYAKCFPE